MKSEPTTRHVLTSNVSAREFDTILVLFWVISRHHEALMRYQGRILRTGLRELLKPTRTLDSVAKPEALETNRMTMIYIYLYLAFLSSLYR